MAGSCVDGQHNNGAGYALSRGEEGQQAMPQHAACSAILQHPCTLPPSLLPSSRPRKPAHPVPSPTGPRCPAQPPHAAPGWEMPSSIPLLACAQPACKVKLTSLSRPWQTARQKP